MTKPRLAPPPPAPAPAEPTAATPDSIERQQAAHDFITAAPGKGGPRKWLLPGVRPDVRVSFSMRLPEDLCMKLDWLARRAEIGRNQFILDALEEYTRAELERVGAGR